MRAEAAFLQGRLTDAHIELESACARIQDNGQANMALCCDFLAWRLSLFAEMKYHCTLAERHAELLRQHNASWLNLWNAIAAYYYAFFGKTPADSGGFSRTGFQPCIHLHRASR